LDRDLSKALIYQGNVSLGFYEENRHMKRVLQNLAAEAGMSGYVPPKRHRMANELLDWHHTQLIPIVEKQLMNASASECPLYYSLTFDGWDNASRTHLLGVMAVSRRGGVHVDSVDTTGVDLLGKEWTVLQIKAQVAKLGGVERLVAVVLDTPSVNKAALTAYELENPTVAGLYCVCHCESLFLKDVFDKLEFATVTWKRVHAICKKFRAVKWLKEKLADKQTSMPLKEGAC